MREEDILVYQTGCHTGVPAPKRVHPLLQFYYLSSGPCMTLIISKEGAGEGIIPEFRDLIGPKDVNVAKEEAPNRCVFSARVSVITAGIFHWL